MMLFFEASSLIKAPPETIWAVLVDSARYPTWDSGVEKDEGQIGPGAPSPSRWLSWLLRCG